MRVCVNVETFEIFTYICAGRQLSNNLVPHLSYPHPLAGIVKNHYETSNYHFDFYNCTDKF